MCRSVITANMPELYKFSPIVLEWERSGSSSYDPPARSSFGFTSAHGRLYLFGGIGDSGALIS